VPPFKVSVLTVRQRVEKGVVDDCMFAGGSDGPVTAPTGIIISVENNGAGAVSAYWRVPGIAADSNDTAGARPLAMLGPLLIDHAAGPKPWERLRWLPCRITCS
jgi:hypothetical protein